MLKHDDPNAPSGFRYELTQEEFDSGLTTAFFTGPISGTVGIPGAAYDVTEDVIAVRPEHVEALQLAIHRTHHAAGRFLDAPLPD